MAHRSPESRKKIRQYAELAFTRKLKDVNGITLNGGCMRTHLKQFLLGLALVMIGTVASAQAPAGSVKVPGQATYIQQQPGAPDNVYRDAEGNLYTISVQPMNSVSCDAGGCTVMTCQGGGNTSPCSFQRCDQSRCRPIKGAS
jgi:hypothetical protein